jgi:hypothetical protein
MTDCVWLSDRMPAVARGLAEWTPEEMRHLSGCPVCRQEWELIRLAAHLGESVGTSFDSPAMASSVLQRVRREREVQRRRRRTWTFTGLAAAAAVTAAVWTGALERPTTGPSATAPLVAAQLTLPLPELESLQAAELDSVLQTMDEPNINGAAVDDPGLGDLNSEELESVLHSWEG